jgi:hypothetical protein
MGQRLTLWRDSARELAIMLALTMLGIGALSIAAVLAGTMPAFLALAIWGG